MLKLQNNEIFAKESFAKESVQHRLLSISSIGSGSFDISINSLWIRYQKIYQRKNWARARIGPWAISSVRKDAIIFNVFALKF